MSVKLPAMFEQNPPHTFDKIVKKQQKMLPKHKTMFWGTKNMPTKKRLSRRFLSNWCDADVDADEDADSSKTICPSPPYGKGGRHNK